MKMTNEQFESLINLINCSIGVCNDVAYEPIYKINFEKARALLVDDEPQLTNVLGAYVNGKYFPMYNPKTHFVIPFKWSDEQCQSIYVEFIKSRANVCMQDAFLKAITKVFANKEDKL